MSDLNPYESPRLPEAQLEVQAVPVGGDVIPFESGHTRATWAVGMLVAVMLCDLLGVGVTYSQIHLLERAQSGAKISPAEAQSNDGTVALAGVLQLVASLGSAVAFLMWFHRAHRNLPALGARNLKYTPGWAVGSFFVPILNLFRPCQIMKEVWRGSDPVSHAGGFYERSPQHAPVSPLVGWWWALWILMNVANQLAMRSSIGAESIDALLASSWASLVGDGISIPAAVLAILLVRSVDANQEERYRLLTRAAPAYETSAVDPFAH